MSVYNGKVYLYDEEGNVYLTGDVVTETSGHDWVSPVTVTEDIVNLAGEVIGHVYRDEFKESATSLADRLSENEQFGISSHIEDPRYMEMGKHERVCQECCMVTRKGAPCTNCDFHEGECIVDACEVCSEVFCELCTPACKQHMENFVDSLEQ